MKIYKEPIWRYLVINHGRFFFRIGYKLRRWYFGTCCINRFDTTLFALWLAGLFLQIDYDKKQESAK